MKTVPTQASSQVGAYLTTKFSGPEKDGSPVLAALPGKNLRRSRPCPEFTDVSGSQGRMVTQPLVLCSNEEPSWTEDSEISFCSSTAEFVCLLRHLQHYKNILQRLGQTLPQSLCPFPKTPGPSESPHRLPRPCAPGATGPFLTPSPRTTEPCFPSSPFTATATATATLFPAALCVPLPSSSPCIICSKSLTTKESSKSQIRIVKLLRLSHPTAGGSRSPAQPEP